MTQDNGVQFTWTLEREQADERRSQLSEAGGTAERIEVEAPEQLLFLAAALPTILPYVAPIIIAGTASLSVIVRAIIALKGVNKPGTIIDVRGGTLSVYENKGVPQYVIVVITSSGTTNFDLRKDPRFEDVKLGDALTTLIKDARETEAAAKEKPSEKKKATEAAAKGKPSEKKKATESSGQGTAVPTAKKQTAGSGSRGNTQGK